MTHTRLNARNFVLGEEGRLWFDVKAGVNGCYMIANKPLASKGAPAGDQVASGRK